MDLIKQLVEQDRLSHAQKLIKDFLGTPENREMMVDYMSDVMTDQDAESPEVAAALTAAEHLDLEPDEVPAELVNALVNNYNSIVQGRENEEATRSLKDIINGHENEEIVGTTVKPGDIRAHEFLKISPEQLEKVLDSITKAVSLEDDPSMAAQHALAKHIDWFVMAPVESQNNMVTALTNYWLEHKDELAAKVDPYKGS